jgi:hypothetical protein
MKNACIILVGKPERERLIGRPRRRWEDDTRIDIREMAREGVDWMHLAHVREKWWSLVNAVMNLWVP